MFSLTDETLKVISILAMFLAISIFAHFQIEFVTMYLKSDDYVESKYLADIMDKQTLELESLRKTLEVHNSAILKLQEEIEHLYSDLSTNDDKLLAIEDKLETKASKKKVRRAENHIDMLNQYIANKLSPLIQCCGGTTRDDTIHEDA